MPGKLYKDMGGHFLHPIFEPSRAPEGDAVDLPEANAPGRHADDEARALGMAVEAGVPQAKMEAGGRIVGSDIQPNQAAGRMTELAVAGTA